MLSVYRLVLSLQMSFQQMTWGRVNTYPLLQVPAHALVQLL